MKIKSGKLKRGNNDENNSSDLRRKLKKDETSNFEPDYTSGDASEIVSSLSFDKNKSSVSTSDSESVADDESGSDSTSEKLSNLNDENPEPSTVSIAVPSSILRNSQSPVLKTYLIGQIARAACIFRVDEIIIYDDEHNSNINRDPRSHGTKSQNISKNANYMAQVLKYLECPQYLRKFFFPLRDDFKYLGVLNPLDAPHHLREDSRFMYREGVCKNYSKRESGVRINAGLRHDVLVTDPVVPGIRVTVKLNYIGNNTIGTIVSPRDPRRTTGVYWGYTVRLASGFSEIFSKCPYGSYDLKIGTSDRGSSIKKVKDNTLSYHHAIIVFGGLQGIEESIENDEEFRNISVKNIFHKYLNVLPNQGTRTIRTEEAIMITLSRMEEKLNPNVPTIPFKFSSLLPQSQDTNKQVGARNTSKSKQNNLKREHQK